MPRSALATLLKVSLKGLIFDETKLTLNLESLKNCLSVFFDAVTSERDKPSLLLLLKHALLRVLAVLLLRRSGTIN